MTPAEVRERLAVAALDAFNDDAHQYGIVDAILRTLDECGWQVVPKEALTTNGLCLMNA